MENSTLDNENKKYAVRDNHALLRFNAFSGLWAECLSKP